MKKLLISLAILLICVLPVEANEQGILPTSDELSDIEQQFDFDLDALLTMTPGDYLELAVEGIAQQMREPLIAFATIIAVLLLSSIARGVTPQGGLPSGGVSTTLDSIINAVFFLILLAPVLSMQGVLTDAITLSKDFLDSFLMVFISLLATSGQVGTAAVAAGFFSAAVFIISELLVEVVIPIAGIYLSLKSCSLCVSSVEFGGIAEVIRKAARYIMMGVATLFTALMGMQSLIASTADNVALRTGKFIVGNGVPIIGSAIQEAITTVIGGISAVKTTAGVSAIVAVILIFAPLVVRCVAYLFLLTLASVSAEISGSQKVMELMRAAVHTMEIFFSCIVMFCLMIILSLLIFMLSGGIVN